MLSIEAIAAAKSSTHKAFPCTTEWVAAKLEPTMAGVPCGLPKETNRTTASSFLSGGLLLGFL